MLDDFCKAIAEGLVEDTLQECSRWATRRLVMPPPHEGPFTFKYHPWQKDILNSKAVQISAKKSAQMGYSVAGMAKALHNIEQKRVDTLYVLPTAVLAGDFSKARLANVLNQSPQLRDLFQKGNAVGLKIAHNGSSLYIRGSVSESSLVSVPVGFVVVDEFDRCAKNTLSLVWERTASFKDKQLFALSTPTLPEWGISEQYDLGDKRHFQFKCPSCSKYIQLRWPDNVEIHGDCATSPECRDSFYKCNECGNKLPHEGKWEYLNTGIWVPEDTGVHGHESYHINQMYHCTMRAGDLAVAYFKGVGDEAAATEWYNQKLGEAYLIEGARVTEGMIKDAIQRGGGYHKQDARPNDAQRMITMGVDVGSFLDICVVEYLYTANPGNEPHLNSRARVLFEGRLPGQDWHILDHMMAEWQVQYACVDFQPETNKASEFARRFPRHAGLVRYREGTTGTEIKETTDDQRVPFLTIDRTVFFDLALGRFHKGRIELPADVSGSFKEHVMAPCRTYQLDTMGNPQAKYVSRDKPDHLANALVYAEIAHLKAYYRSTGRTMKVGESYFNM